MQPCDSPFDFGAMATDEGEALTLFSHLGEVKYLTKGRAKLGGIVLQCRCRPPRTVTHNTVKKAGPHKGRRFVSCRYFKDRCNWFAYPDLEPGKVARRALNLDLLSPAQRSLVWDVK